MRLWLLVAVGCQHRTPGPGPGPISSLETADSGATPTPPGIRVTQDPSVRIVGLAGMQLDLHTALFPAHGADRGLIFAHWSGPEGDDPVALPVTFVLAGDVPAGTHLVTDLWDGVSSVDDGFVEYHVRVAGDVNDDGHLDLWWGDDLHLGPFLGRELRYHENSVAYVDGDGFAGAADFDADGDGHEDVLMVACCQTGVSHYGPFEGRVAGLLSGEADPSSVSQLGDFQGCSNSTQSFFLAGHLGPGHSAVAIGSDGADMCSTDSYVFDLQQPRGASLRMDESLAYSRANGWMAFDQASDLDADGAPEVVFGDWRGSFLLSAPFAGFVPDAPASMAVGLGAGYDGAVHQAVGDMNGDGVDELLVVWVRSYEPYEASFVVVFSPHPDPVDPSDGVELGLKDDLTTTGDGFGYHADLDGDGTSDLVGTYRLGEDDDAPPELVDAGEIRVWYGRDLMEAEAERTDADRWKAPRGSVVASDVDTSVPPEED